ncbi:hypothetical protein Tco_0742088 [Tanacetum coccineum]
MVNPCIQYVQLDECGMKAWLKLKEKDATTKITRIHKRISCMWQTAHDGIMYPIDKKIITRLSKGLALFCFIGDFAVEAFNKSYQMVNDARDSVMSSASSTVTYTSVDTDSEPGRAFWPADEELSDGGSPRVIVYGYDGLPIQPVAPPSPDYIPGPEDPQAPQVPQDEDEREPMFVQAHDPDYVPEPIYPEYIPLEDEHVYPAEEQPLPPVDSPTALSPGYVADSDPEEDPEEDSEEEHVDYPADGGDDDDDDDDTDDEDEEPFKEEEEHLALADPFDVPVVNHVPSAEDTKALEPDEPVPTPPSPPAYRTTARISIRPEAPILLPPEEEVERLLALPTPPPSPLISLSPPTTKERLARCLAAPALPSSPLPRLPHLYGSPNHVRAPPGFRATMGRLRASSPLPPPVPTSLLLPSPPLPPLPSSLLPPLPDSLFIPPVDRREDIPEAELPPCKRLCLTTPASRYKAGESLTVVPRPTGGHRRYLGRPERDCRGGCTSDTSGGQTLRVVELAAIREQDNPGTSTADHRIDAQDSLIATLTAQVSSQQGHLAMALSEIRALQARDQACANAPEGTASTAHNMPPMRSSATARAAAAARAAVVAAPMTAAAVEQLIEARVSTALANHETL